MLNLDRNSLQIVTGLYMGTLYTQPTSAHYGSTKQPILYTL